MHTLSEASSSHCTAIQGTSREKLRKEVREGRRRDKERIISEVGTFRRLGQLNRPHLARLCDRHTNEFTTV